MYMSRENKMPPCEDSMLDLLLEAQSFKAEFENNDTRDATKPNSLQAKTSCPEIRQTAKLALASVSTMRKNIFIYSLFLSNTLKNALICMYNLLLGFQKLKPAIYSIFTIQFSNCCDLNSNTNLR